MKSVRRKFIVALALFCVKNRKREKINGKSGEIDDALPISCVHTNNEEMVELLKEELQLKGKT